jgi:hypothetical protein
MKRKQFFSTNMKHGKTRIIFQENLRKINSTTLRNTHSISEFFSKCKLPRDITLHEKRTGAKPKGQHPFSL